MTRQRLKNYNALLIALKTTNERIKELESLAENTTPNYSNEPRGNKTSDKVGEYASVIVDLLIKQKELNKEIAREIFYIDAWINDIEDALTREIFRLRYINGLKWRDVAQRLGGGNTENGIKSIHHRYLSRGN